MEAKRVFNLGRVNTVALICIVPFFLRLWIEAVIWRLERGPQMLGFSLVHGGAGWLTPVLLFSALIAFLYFWIGGLLILTYLVPWVRARTRGMQFVVFGVAVIPAFTFFADALQDQNASSIMVIAGGVGLALLIAAAGWTCYAGWHGGRLHKHA